MLNKNVGLRDICHSITGGALVAQGKSCTFRTLGLVLPCHDHPTNALIL